MTFEIFAEKVRQRVAAEYIDCRVEVREFTKNNGRKLKGLLVVDPGKTMQPVVYLNDLYREDIREDEIDQCAIKVIRLMKERQINVPENTKKCLFDFDTMKDHIIFNLINTKKNLNMLENCPHIKYLDMTVVFKIDFGTAYESIATALITYTLMDIWGVDEQKLWEVALCNNQRRYPVEHKSMNETLKELFGHNKEMIDMLKYCELENDMFVVTNKQKILGAGTILYPDVLKEMHKELGHDFYLAMSSIHEFIVFAMTDVVEHEFKEMIAEINKTQVAEDEVLSDSLYFYNGKNLVVV